MDVVYRADPTTGQVFETKEYRNEDEKTALLKDPSGGWMETPRWKYDPKPNGPSQENPLERVSKTPIPALPCVLHGPKLATMQVGTEEEKAKQLKVAGWTEQPQGETWHLGDDKTWTIHTVAERQVIQALNTEIRKAQHKGELPDDEPMWALVTAAQKAPK